MAKGWTIISIMPECSHVRRPGATTHHLNPIQTISADANQYIIVYRFVSPATVPQQIHRPTYDHGGVQDRGSRVPAECLPSPPHIDRDSMSDVHSSRPLSCQSALAGCTCRHTAPRSVGSTAVRTNVRPATPRIDAYQLHHEKIQPA